MKKLNFQIEIHEWPLGFNMAYRIGVSFSKPHTLQIVESKSDINKAKNYAFIQLLLLLNSVRRSGSTFLRKIGAEMK